MAWGETMACATALRIQLSSLCKENDYGRLNRAGFLG